MDRDKTGTGQQNEASGGAVRIVQSPLVPVQSDPALQAIPALPLSNHTGAPDQAAPPPLAALRRYTPARIALGRIGASLPTAEVLDFSMAHARARDAVHLPLDLDSLASAFEHNGFATIQVRSQAADRGEYLRRPDLGRRLRAEYRSLLADTPGPPHRLTVVVADGLSSLAPLRHALPLVLALQRQLASGDAGRAAGDEEELAGAAECLHRSATQRPAQVGARGAARESLQGATLPAASAWVLDTIILVSQARVALADEVAELRGAEAVVMLLGERPGLSSPDSLGIYMTYAPKVGCADSLRNCISNVREAGLSYAEAAYKLCSLLHQSRAAGTSGITIKDTSDWDPGPRSLL